MAALVAKPNGALRQRQRPSLATRNMSRNSIDGSAIEDGNISRKLVEPFVKDTPFILRKFRNKPPSLIIHLYPTHFRINDNDESLQYDGPMKILIEHLKRQTVPHEIVGELLESAVPFYDGMFACDEMWEEAHKLTTSRMSYC